MRFSKIIVMALAAVAAGWAQGPKVGWSLGYYCGWDQGGFAPAQIDWKAFTHIAHFTVFPNNDGTLDVSGNGLTDGNCKAVVAEARKHGVKIVFSIGGAGAKDRFKSACSPANVHTFVKNLLDFMRKYGYDGIDTDWEENFDDGLLVAWHKELRDSLDKITPRPLLTMAGGGYFASHCAPAHPYLDMLNTMSYDILIGGMTGEMRSFTSRGVPKEKLGIGIGIGSGTGLLKDADSNMAKAKVVFSIDNGLGGIMEWAVQGSARHVSIYKMIEQYIPPSPSEIWSDGRRRVIRDGALFAGRNAITGKGEIRYAVGGAGAFVDLGLWDAQGKMRRALVSGPSPAGTFSIPWEAGSLPAGRYILRLSAGGSLAAVPVSIGR